MNNNNEKMDISICSQKDEYKKNRTKRKNPKERKQEIDNFLFFWELLSIGNSFFSAKEM